MWRRAKVEEVNGDNNYLLYFVDRGYSYNTKDIDMVQVGDKIPLEPGDTIDSMVDDNGTNTVKSRRGHGSHVQITPEYIAQARSDDKATLSRKDRPPDLLPLTTESQ